MKAVTRVGRGLNVLFIAFLLIGALTTMMPAKGEGYIMPADQLLGLMVANFSKFSTLVITQNTNLSNPYDLETKTVMEERLWVTSDGFFRRELIGGFEGQSMRGNDVEVVRLSTDMSFYRLLMANDVTTISRLLSEMGVNVEAINLTRFNGVVAYRIGDKDPKSLKLLIEKERFLPLLLSYRPLGDPGQGMVTVVFYDYRKLLEGWYPYKIDYVIGETPVERYFILDLQINVPVEPSLLKTLDEGVRPHQSLEDRQDTLNGERLKEIIRVLREKYQ